jgi:hypothetical protein
MQHTLKMFVANILITTTLLTSTLSLFGLIDMPPLYFLILASATSVEAGLWLWRRRNNG